MAPVPWQFIPIGVFFTCCSILGGFANMIIIIVTIRTKGLRSTCNDLIAISCFADFWHVQGHWIFMFYIVSGIEIPLNTCFYIEILSASGLHLCGPMCLVLSANRFIAVALPMRYMILQYYAKTYALVLMILPAVYVATRLAIGIAHIAPVPMPCSLPLIITTMDNWYLSTVLNCTYGASAIIYILVIIILKKKGANAQFKTVFKSLTVILTLVTINFFLTNILFDIGDYFFTGFALILWYQYCGIAINLAITANGYVFYFLNLQYRAAVNKLFGVAHERNILFVSSTHGST